MHRGFGCSRTFSEAAFAPWEAVGGGVRHFCPVSRRVSCVQAGLRLSPDVLAVGVGGRSVLCSVSRFYFLARCISHIPAQQARTCVRIPAPWSLLRLAVDGSLAVHRGGSGA